MTDYDTFLRSKQRKLTNLGKPCQRDQIDPILFEFQKDIVSWSVHKGRAAIFLDTGMGKTFCQLEWARLLGENTLIIAPLSVSRQTIREAVKLGTTVTYVTSQEQVTGSGIWITNYEHIDSFVFSQFGAVVLDESSILKSISGATRRRLTDYCKDIPYRLACTATPAPNDNIEIGNHAEFLGICSQAEMLATFFINANKEHTYLMDDGRAFRRKGSNKAGTEWRLKHHAEKPFFEWLSSWAITMTKPSDLGYDDNGFILPELKITTHSANVDYVPDDQLFFTGLKGIQDRAKVRAGTVDVRLLKVLELIHSENMQYNVWYENEEGIPTGMDKGKPGTHPGISRTDQRETQCSQERIVCKRREQENTSQERSKGMAGEKSAETESTTPERIWDNSRRISGDAGKTELQMCDMRVLGNDQSTVFSDSGSLPCNWESQGITMHELQSGNRETERLDRTSGDCNCIFENQWIVWCGLDVEQNMLSKELENFGISYVSVYGSLSPEEKEIRINKFIDREVQVMVTKCKILGFGMNFQNAHNMVFFGLNDSWEVWYQAIRRMYRFGQKQPVNVHVVISQIENEIYQNIQRKDNAATRLRQNLIDHIKKFSKGELEMVDTVPTEYQEKTVKEGKFIAMMGDSCLRLAEMADNSVDLSVYSPPFADLYTYTDSEHDLGNSRDRDEFLKHYAFIIEQVLRVTKQGRLSCVHTSDIPAMAQKDGYIGIKDFPGDVIRAHQEAGWIFYGRAFVPKNPQALRDGTNVLTPYGWEKINELELGDMVIGVNGKATTVSGVFHHANKQLYRVTFSDGVSVDCHSEHLWTIKSKSANWKTVTTEKLFLDGIYDPSGTPRYRIPIIDSPAEFRKTPYDPPIDPYLLGVLLGDGGISQDRTVEICTDEEILLKLQLPEGHKVVFRPGGDRANGMVRTGAIVCDEWHKNDILDALRKLGLQGKRAWEKFIPDNYLYASAENRQKLLCGLLDTDGTVKRSGSIVYSTTSEQLAKNVQELVFSLGGIGLVSKGDGAKYHWNGEDRFGQDLFSVFVQLPGKQNPFSLKRKADKWHPRQRGFWRSIIDIEKIDTDNCTCITVDAADGLFVTENYVVTHNSQAIRTKSKALLFVQLRKDSSDSRPALVDQILIFKKPGQSEVPVKPVDNKEIDNETWIQWANAIWWGINESDTLQYTTARDGDDEKHICPLQLGTIERCIKLYSNPGETVLTPFMGIGSEAYMALKLHRKAIGIELKPSYFAVAVKNLRHADAQNVDLFSLAGIDV